MGRAGAAEEVEHWMELGYVQSRGIALCYNETASEKGKKKEHWRDEELKNNIGHVLSSSF